MRKSYFLGILLVLIASELVAQTNLLDHNIDVGTPIFSEEQYVPMQKKSTIRKAPPAGAAIFFYEDFDTTGSTNGLPVGWTAINATANNHDWIWSNSAPGGQYSTTIPPLASVTASNGYLLLPSDLYNTPFPTAGPIPMDAWVTSPSFPIGINYPSVYVEYQHFVRYCCSVLNELVLEVSTDGINWSVPYDANNGRGPATMSPNGVTERINVSVELGSQIMGYIRFRSTGNSHFFWMIDDVYVYEGDPNSMLLEEMRVDFHPSYDIKPIYKQYPYALFHGLRHTGYSYNEGAVSQTNSLLNLKVFMDSSMNGGPGAGLVHSTHDTINTQPNANAGVVPAYQRDTTRIQSPFFSWNTGWFRSQLSITTDSINPARQNGIAEYSYAITADSVIALENANWTGTSGPPSYVGGGNDGDRAAALFILDSAASVSTVTANSISVYIPNRVETDGLMISPRIWRFDSVIQTPPVGTSNLSVTIGAAQQGNWVTLPLLPPVTLGPGAYYFGVEQTGGGSNGKELWLGRDVSQENIAPQYSNVFFLNEPGFPRWIAPPRILGIRLNLASLPVGIEENSVQNSKFEFMVYPNPNDGVMTFNINTQLVTSYQLSVRNTLGRTVHEEVLNVNGSLTKQIDLTSFEKGIYFITLEGEGERIAKKVVIQ